jgi:hypothetical protein
MLSVEKSTPSRWPRAGPRRACRGRSDTRARPRFYLHYRVGKKADGSAQYEMRAAKGARTMEDARKQLVVLETRLAQGLSPVPEEQSRPTGLRPLLERWRDGLGNRNADDDRSRIDRHLLTRFGKPTIDKLTLAEIMGRPGAKGEGLIFPFEPAKPQNRSRTSTWTGYARST